MGWDGENTRRDNFTPRSMCASTLPRLVLIKRMRTFPFSNYCLPLQTQPSLPLLLWAAGTFFNLLQVHLVYNFPLGSLAPLT